MERHIGRPRSVELGGGGGESENHIYKWYLNTLSIKDSGGTQVSFTKVAANRWTFTMPDGDVVINGTFSQTPTKSSYLQFLNVGVSSTITPGFGTASNNHYTAKIPHIFPTDQNQKFSIIAIPEDPDAAVSITPATQEESGEYELTEGITEYTITVSRNEANPPTNTYNFTVSYEPDLTLKSIKLSNSGNPNWTPTIAVQDGQVITVPYDSVTIEASPNDDEVKLAASTSPGSASLSTDEQGKKWTLTYTYAQGTGTLNSTVKIKSTKNVKGSDYTKDFTLQFENIADENWPTSYWATSIPNDNGNGVSIIKDTDGNYYEVHTFINSGTLSVNSIPAEGLTARVLVVAGGGGGGSGSSGSDQGGGGGGGGAGYSENVSLAATNYNIIVGSGGNGNSKGNNSSFANITVEGGGKGGLGNRHNSTDSNALKGGDGGSGGGGGAGGGELQGPGGSATSHNEVTGWQFYGGTGDQSSNGTPGGNGGSANFSNNISGTLKEYGKGGIGGGASGNTPAVNGTGNGGKGSDGVGSSGSNGIVIVRFPAKLNSE